MSTEGPLSAAGTSIRRSPVLPLAVALALGLAACYSPPVQRRVEYREGVETFRAQGPPHLAVHVLEVDVARERRIGIRLRFVNEGEDEVRFLRRQVSLHYRGRKLAARDLEHGGDVTVPRGGRIDRRWGFHCDEKPAAETYVLTIAGVSFGDGATGGEAQTRDLSFPITVP